ncbi:MAG: peroxiredoxin [Anaerolineae bacterium]|nr:peroxiredoxin [Anaerolineae bacterium]
MTAKLTLQQFANIPLTTDENKSVTLADFVGKRTLLFVFPKADTDGCTRQACGFRDNFPRIQEAGAQILGISADDPKLLAKWKKKFDLPYTLLSDPDHKIIEAFGTWGEKSMYGKKYLGIIRSHFIFDAAGKLEDAQVKISPEDSINKGTSTLVQAKVARAKASAKATKTAKPATKAAAKKPTTKASAKSKAPGKTTPRAVSKKTTTKPKKTSG